MDEAPASHAFPTTPRERRRAQTMIEIHDAAIEVMAQDGVAALNLTRVAHRVGLRQPSLYQYVASRADLYDSLFKLAASEHLRVTREAIAGSAPGWQAARAICARTLEFAAAEPVLSQLLFTGSVPGFTPSEQAYAPSVEAMEAMREQMTIAVTKGELSRSAATESGLVLLLSLVAGLGSQRAANDPDSPPGQDRFLPLLPAALDMYQTYFAQHQTGREGVSATARHSSHDSVPGGAATDPTHGTPE